MDMDVHHGYFTRDNYLGYLYLSCIHSYGICILGLGLELELETSMEPYHDSIAQDIFYV